MLEVAQLYLLLNHFLFRDEIDNESCSQCDPIWKNYTNVAK